MKTKLLITFFSFIIILFTNCLPGSSPDEETRCSLANQVPDGQGGCRNAETAAELEKRLQEENGYTGEEDDYNVE